MSDGTTEHSIVVEELFSLANFSLDGSNKNCLLISFCHLMGLLIHEKNSECQSAFFGDIKFELIGLIVLIC